MSYEALVTGCEKEQAVETLTTIAQALIGEYPEGSEAHRLLGYITRRDWTSVVGYELDYKRDWLVNELIDVRQALALFQKNDAVVDLGIDKTEAALSKFILADDTCRFTNELFTSYEAGELCFANRHAAAILFLAQRKISKLLGVLPSFSEMRGRHGKGATISVKKRDASARAKFSKRVCCSPSLLKHLPEVAAAYPHMIRGEQFLDADESAFVVGERVDVALSYARLGFVRKNVKTFRTTVTEPDLNMFLQLGYGDFVADRLLTAGVDIFDQTRNQKLAREGSITGALATLDLVSASDMNARLLCRSLLPFDHYSLVVDLSSPDVVFPDGTVRRLSMISTMGNGSTFPLETLIFWGLTTATCEYFGHNSDQVSIYGDDIICPSQAALQVKEILNICGFTVNSAKSFWEGPFRESCGKDYYSGIDIRPAYMKGEEPVTVLSLFTLHNHFIAQHRFDIAEVIVGLIPEHYRLFGPPLYGDGHLHAINWRGKPHNRDAGWAGYIFETFSLKGPRHTKPLPGDFVYTLYTTYLKGEDSKQVEPKYPFLKDFSLSRAERVAELRHASLNFEGTAETTHQTSRKLKRGGKFVIEWRWNTALPLSDLPEVNKISIYTLAIPPVRN